MKDSAPACKTMTKGISELSAVLDVSIIIVSWNTCDILLKCLRSIYEKQNNMNFEVIVVDNASADGSAEKVSDNFSQVILIKNQENRGFAAANNQGIGIAKGRYILLLNSDTIVLNNAIAKTLSFAEAHPEVALVGCRILNPDMSLQPSCFMFPSVLNMLLSSSYMYKLFPKSKFFGREHMTLWNRDEEREVDVATGCFMLVRREAIEQVGVMDEQFFMYGEETDWCYRFKQAGWKVMFTPEGEIIHLGGRSTIQKRSEMLVQLRLSILKFIKKHQNWLKSKIACFLTILFFATRIPIWLVIALFDPRRKKTSIERAHAYLAGIGKVLFCQA